MFEGLNPTPTDTPTPTPTPTRTLPQKEFKSKRVQLLMKPSVVARLDAYATSIGSNRNDMLNKIVEEFLCDEEYRFKFEEKFLVEED